MHRRKMKARIKATGHIIEVIPYSGFDDYDYYEPKEKMPWLKEQLVFDVTDKDDTYNKGWQAGWDEAVKSEIPKIHPKLKGLDPDYWTRLEHTYAGMAMQGMLNNSYLAGEFRKDPNNGIEDMSKIITKAAAVYAHALVEKMKEEK